MALEHKSHQHKQRSIQLRQNRCDVKRTGTCITDPNPSSETSERSICQARNAVFPRIQGFQQNYCDQRARQE